jgi:glycogen synthase
MTGLVPPAAAEKGIKSLFTLHNVFTEKETPLNIDRSGIDVRRFMKRLYFEQFPDESAGNWAFNRVDFAASGIHAADIVNTVSETFLEEIVNGEFRGIIPPSISHTVAEKYRANQALGILNAPNDSVDPRVSSYITPFDIEDVMEKKSINKSTFQERMGLDLDPDAPLFLWPSRLYPQKGPTLLQKIIKGCIENYGMQLGLVANGDQSVEQFFQALSKNYDGKVAHKSFSEDLSKLGKSAADFVLMPSMYEPCGLPQMECPRFGTLPVARLTGGIKDTVWELDPTKEVGNGFVFNAFTAEALEGAVKRAISFYRQPVEVKRKNIQRVMRESFQTFTLEHTANKYIQVYETLMAGEAGPKEMELGGAV